MKPETNLYHTLAYALEDVPIKLHRIETATELGVPDLFFNSFVSSGWGELKYIKSYPKKVGTLIDIPYRPGQYGWLMDYVNLNPYAIGVLILQIEKDFFIFRNEGIQLNYTRQELIEKSVYHTSMSMVNRKNSRHIFYSFGELSGNNKPKKKRFFNAEA